MGFLNLRIKLFSFLILFILLVSTLVLPSNYIPTAQAEEPMVIDHKFYYLNPVWNENYQKTFFELFQFDPLTNIKKKVLNYQLSYGTSIAVGPSGKLYYMYSSFDLYEYDPYTKIERKVVTVPVSSFGVNEVFASSDGMVYAASSNSGGSNGNATLWKIDPNSGSMQSVDYNPDGSNFFNFSEDYDGNIYYMASRGSGRKYNPVTDAAGAAGNGSWNGQAFEVNPDGTIYATHTGFMGTNSVNITKNGYSVGTIGGNIGAVNVKASRTPNLAYIYCGPPGYYYSTNGCYPNYPDQGIFRYD